MVHPDDANPAETVVLQAHDGVQMVTEPLLLPLRDLHPDTGGASLIRRPVKSGKGATSSFFK
jgi:hypothetical protein